MPFRTALVTRLLRNGIALVISFATVLVFIGVPSAQATTPSAPSGLAVSSATTTTLTASWNPVDGATSYTAKAYSASSEGSELGTCLVNPATSTTCVITGLTDGTTHYVAVSVTTAGGTSVESARVAGTTIPIAPTGLAVSSATATTLTASWTSVSGASSYSAIAYDASSGGTAVRTCTPSPSTNNTCVITGLSNVTNYYIAVNVTKAGATSADSTRVSGTTLASAPSAPQGVTANGADASLSVAWSAPSSNGGASVTGYTAQAWTAAVGGSVAERCTTGASGTGCTLTPLTNGTTYYVSVFATNSQGDGAESARIARTPGSLPGAPRSLSTSRGDGNVTVTWSAPLSEGSSTVTSYTARVRTAASSSAEIVGTCTSTGLTCTVSGLTNNSTYYVSVTATSAIGEGGPSSFARITALNAPGAPRNVTARAGSGYAAVSWSAPTSTGGSSITKYTVHAYHVAEGGEPIATCESNPVSSLKCDLGPLPNGGNYFIDVTARNSLLTGAPSTPRVSLITAALPEEPRNVTAEQVGASLQVRWQTPLTDGGRPITRYTANAYASPSSTSSLGSCTSSGDTCMITGVAGYVYVAVTATTAAGTGPASQPRMRVFVTGLPDAPRAVAADQRGRTLSVSWLRPLDDQGIPIARYDVQVTGQGDSVKKTCSLFAPKVPKDADPWAHRFSCSVGGLQLGATYTVSVLAANSISEVTSPAISVRMRAGAPSAPRDVSFLPGDDVIAVGALLPASRGGAKTITLQFRAWTKASGGKVSARCTSQLQQDDSIGLCQLTGLLNYEPYWIDASAKSSRGSSATIARVKVEPSPQVPTAPRDFRLRVKGAEVVASWEAPIFDGGFPIRRYIVRATNKQVNGEIVKTCITQAPELTCEITGLDTDQHLWFTVVAENTVGESQPSDQLDRTT